MPARFDENDLLKRLAKLDQKGLLTFALSCAERMLPSYQHFSREHGWGNTSVLRKTLDLGWAWLESGIVDKDSVAKLQEACANEAPHTEDFDSLYVSPALDAANAAANVAKLLLRADAETTVEIATFARDTVDMYVQELEKMPANTLDLEERIQLHPMMQRELKNQQEALSAITAGISPRDASRRWRSPKRSNIDLS
jgi:hypothetical protein